MVFPFHPHHPHHPHRPRPSRWVTSGYAYGPYPYAYGYNYPRTVIVNKPNENLASTVADTTNKVATAVQSAMIRNTIIGGAIAIVLMIIIIMIMMSILKRK